MTHSSQPLATPLIVVPTSEPAVITSVHGNFIALPTALLFLAAFVLQYGRARWTLAVSALVKGVVAAAREVSLHVPLVVRLAGTNVELGKKILSDSGLPILSADDLADAAEKVVQAVREAA